MGSVQFFQISPVLRVELVVNLKTMIKSVGSWRSGVHSAEEKFIMKCPNSIYIK